MDQYNEVFGDLFKTQKIGMRENTLEAMYVWAIENHLEEEFVAKIKDNMLLESWFEDGTIWEVFGRFVLAHSNAEHIINKPNHSKRGIYHDRINWYRQ